VHFEAWGNPFRVIRGRRVPARWCVVRFSIEGIAEQFCFLRGLCPFFCAYPGLTSWAKVGRRCRGWSFGPIIRGTLRAVLIFRGRGRPRHAGQRPRTGVSALHGEDCPVKRWGARAGPETHFCAYPGLTSWAIVGRPCRGWSLCRSHMFGGPGAGDPVWRARGARATPVRSRGQECPRYTGKIVRANGCGARAGPEPFFLRLPRTYSWAIIRRPCRR